MPKLDFIPSSKQSLALGSQNLHSPAGRAFASVLRDMTFTDAQNYFDVFTSGKVGCFAIWGVVQFLPEDYINLVSGAETPKSAFHLSMLAIGALPGDRGRASKLDLICQQYIDNLLAQGNESFWLGCTSFLRMILVSDLAGNAVWADARRLQAMQFGWTLRERRRRSN